MEVHQSRHRRPALCCYGIFNIKIIYYAADYYANAGSDDQARYVKQSEQHEQLVYYCTVSICELTLFLISSFVIPTFCIMSNLD